MAVEGKKVLIADDEVDVHEFVRTALEDEGYEILTAQDGQTALEVVRAQAPDVIILDVQMPKKNGFEVFDELRRDDATKAIPVIMLTAVTERTGIPFDARAMGDYMGHEPEAYIDKPVDPVKLRETVNKLAQAPPGA